jgi:hypothetical protein
LKVRPLSKASPNRNACRNPAYTPDTLTTPQLFVCLPRPWIATREARRTMQSSESNWMSHGH